VTSDVRKIQELLRLSSHLKLENIDLHRMARYTENTNSALRQMDVQLATNFYERLGLQKGAFVSERNIRTAYRRQALRWHPDRWAMASPAQQQRAESAFKLVAEAYETLSQPHLKAEYDQRVENDASAETLEARESSMSLDMALRAFNEVYQIFKTAQSRWQPYSAAGQSLAISTASRAPMPGNHGLRLAQHLVRVQRVYVDTGIEYVTYVRPEEVLQSDIIATTRQPAASARLVMTSAVVVGVGLSVAAAMWSQYASVRSKRQRAEILAEMPLGFIRRLHADLPTRSRATTASALLGDSESEAQPPMQVPIQPIPPSSRPALGAGDEMNGDVIAESLDLGSAKLQEPITSTAAAEPGLLTPAEAPSPSEGVTEPFMMVPLCDLDDHQRRLAQDSELSHARPADREAMLQNLLREHRLESAQIGQDSVWEIAKAGGEGAMESGVKAVGGLALSRACTTVSSRMAGRIVAPLAVASVLVDIGREYAAYSKEWARKESNGTLTEAEQMRLRAQFRQRRGLQLVSGLTATAGATAAAYLATAAVAATGPVGVVAATGAAVFGGWFGHRFGSLWYQDRNQSYADELAAVGLMEEGARVLFEAYDERHCGSIDRAKCSALIDELCADAKVDLSADRRETLLNELCEEGDVSWATFFGWVSRQAAERMRNLEKSEPSLSWVPRTTASGMGQSANGANSASLLGPDAAQNDTQAQDAPLDDARLSPPPAPTPALAPALAAESAAVLPDSERSTGTQLSRRQEQLCLLAELLTERWP
jgi:hypothetical protein